MRDISSWLILQDGLRVDFDIITYPMHSDIPFNGKIIASDLHFATIIPAIRIDKSLADLYVRFHFSFTGHPFEAPEEHKYAAIIKRIRN